ncbi:MAG: PqiC family protein [Geminicoccaceae bacterium]
MTAPALIGAARIGPARRLLAALALGLLGACSASEPASFYLLTPEGATAPPLAAGPASGPSLFVDEATLAPYLDRAQLVSRIAPDRVAFADLRLWAEPLPAMASGFVVDRLAARFGPERVQATPARRAFDPDFRLLIDVRRLDGNQAGEMVLDARWTLVTGADERLVATGRERIVAPAADPASWDARVAALREAWTVFSDRVADAVATAWAGRQARRPAA